MKLEFFEDGMDAPLILLYGGEHEEVALFRAAVRVLAEDVGKKLTIHQLPFIQPIRNCRLAAISAEANVGIAINRLSGEYEWVLAQEAWLQVDELLEPFCHERSDAAFQYLNPAGGMEVIYSTHRSW